MKKNKRRQISEARLNAYNRKASADLCVSKWGLRTGSAAAFAVAAAALAAPDTAQASIIFHTASPDQFFSIARPTTAETGGSFRADLDGDGNNDLFFVGDFFAIGLKSAAVLGFTGVGIAVSGGFAQGFGTFGASKNFATRGAILIPFTTNNRTFEGFRFRPAGSDHDDYGWMELYVGSTNKGTPDFLQLLSWAYDDTGAPITAGNEGPPAPEAPEPGTLSMFTGIGLLALGAAGRRELRRRGAARSC